MENGIICIPDSTVFIGTGRYHLSGDTFNSFAESLAQNAARFLVSEFTIKEVVAHHNQEFGSELEKAKKKLAEFIDIDKNEHNIFALYRDAFENYEVNFRQKLIQAGAEIIHIPSLNVTMLISRVLAGKKPFDKNGKGFKDAIFWECVRSIALKEQDAIYIISRDDGFRNPDKGSFSLHPDLVEDLISDGTHERVFLYKEIEEFKQKHFLQNIQSLSPIEVTPPLREQLIHLLSVALELAQFNDSFIARDLVTNNVTFIKLLQVWSLVAREEERIVNELTYRVAYDAFVEPSFGAQLKYPFNLTELDISVLDQKEDIITFIRPLQIRFHAWFNIDSNEPIEVSIQSFRRMSVLKPR